MGVGDDGYGDAENGVFSSGVSPDLLVDGRGEREDGLLVLNSKLPAYG